MRATKGGRCFVLSRRFVVCEVCEGYPGHTRDEHDVINRMHLYLTDLFLDMVAKFYEFLFEHVSIMSFL